MSEQKETKPFFMSWSPSLQKAIVIFATAGWIASVVTGFGILLHYKSTPGIPAAAPAEWPKVASIQYDRKVPTIVMLAHPRCPCTRASVSELQAIVTRLRGQVRTYVLFLKPGEFPEGWEKTDTWTSAQRIPGATVMSDRDGVQTGYFGGETSGQTLVYDTRGQLVFSGGITAIRGHAGENLGSIRLVSLLTRGRADQATSKVFGCALKSPGDQPIMKLQEASHHDRDQSGDNAIGGGSPGNCETNRAAF